MIHRRILILVGIFLAFLVAGQPVFARSAAPSPLAQTGSTFTRITAGSDGLGGGVYGSISASGRYVVFESAAPDLLTGQIFGSWDTLIYDTQSGNKVRASVRTGGAPVENSSDYTSPPAISSSGRFVAFMSSASTLVSGDTNGLPDIFIRDRSNNTTKLVSVGLNGQPANGPSFLPAVSADGRYVAFQSQATNLVTGDTNNSMDIFVRDMQLGVTERASVTDKGQQGTDPHDYGFSSVSISDDGRFVVFSFQQLPIPGTPNIDGPFVYLRDRQEKTTRLIAPGEYPNISTNGSYVVFSSPAALVPADTNNSSDVYLMERGTGSFERISVAAGGREVTNQGIFSAPDVSTDGRYVVFESNANGLISGDNKDLSDIFLRDRQAGTTTLVSMGMQGGPANNESHNPVISADGTTIAFNSLASNITPNDTNDINDVFVLKRTAAAFLPGDKLFYLPIVISH